MKKDKSFTYSVRLPPIYEKVLSAGRKYIKDRPGLVRKTPDKLIFVSDVFRYALDLLADHLELDFSKDEPSVKDASELTFGKMSPEEKLTKKMEGNKEFTKEEYRIAGKLDPESLLEYDLDWKPKGLSLQEYVKFKELDL